MRYPHLLSPLVVRGHIIKNRLESSNSLPHFLQGPEPFPADSVITHYANRAKSGAAIVTCMGINNFSRGAGLPMDMDVSHFPDYDLYDPTCQNYLMQLADAIHFYHSIACMGFYVAGQSGYPLMKRGEGEQGIDLIKVNNPMEPFSGMPKPLIDELNAKCRAAVRDVTEEQMALIADSYAEQCGILKKLGFDMVSIHLCYRGQLPTKFLSPTTNDRTDAYGGSLENRARFPLLILKKVREAVGKDFIVEILFSGEDVEGGYTLADGAAYLNLFAPYVDIVQLRAPEADPNHPTSFNLEETPFLYMAEYMKKAGVTTLLSSVGGWQNPDTAEAALRENKLDLIAAARAWISNPDYGKLIYEDRAEDIVPCLRCNKCHGRGPNDPFVSVCSVNPLIGIEHRLTHLLTPPGPAQKIAVIGGGPAGMKAAIDLHDRGHQVTLFEADDHLGGAIYHSDFVSFKWTLRDFKNYLIRQVGKRKMDVRLNTRATPELIRAEGFDVVIAALGAAPVKPPIPGINGDNVCFAVESMLHPEKLGQDVVVIGGGEVGVEAGMNLAEQGHNVTVLEMRSELAMDTTMIHYRSMFQAAWEKLPTFRGICQATVTGVTPEGVTYRDAAGEEHKVLAQSVVVSAGMRARQQEALDYYGSAPRFFYIGDCSKAATVQQAMRSAFAVASQI